MGPTSIILLTGFRGHRFERLESECQERKNSGNMQGPRLLSGGLQITHVSLHRTSVRSRLTDLSLRYTGRYCTLCITDHHDDWVVAAAGGDRIFSER